MKTDWRDKQPIATTHIGNSEHKPPADSQDQVIRPTDNRPPGTMMIVVIDDRVLIRDCLARCLKILEPDCLVATFASVSEWQGAAAQHPVPSVIVVRARFHHRNGEVNLERELTAITQPAGGVPVILISEAEDAEHVLFALDSGARGYIPTSVTLDVAVEAMRLVKAGGTFVPASSLISAKHKGDASLGANGDGSGLFTPRQAAVVDALRQGKANKRIAYELNMRESTVKVHIRNIMKKLKAKNRTEVAYLTQDLFNGPGQD